MNNVELRWVKFNNTIRLEYRVMDSINIYGNPTWGYWMVVPTINQIEVE